MNTPYDHSPLSPPVTICVLCYGDYPELAHRVLTSLLLHTPGKDFQLRVGLNAVSSATSRMVDRLLPQFKQASVVRSEVNLYKSGMMRRLFYDEPIKTPWTIWFDDDSHVFREDWLTVLGCESRLRPELGMWGRRLFIRAGYACKNFIFNASWYHGLVLLPHEDIGWSKLSFIAGGYWAIRTRWLYQLDWPDKRLIHFGDDYMLGEALRQNGVRLGEATSGVAINQSARRAPAGTPRSEALA